MPEDSTPLYQIVVKALQAEIVRGIHGVGSLLPSETNLMERFGVSRQTVRSAIRSLRDAGLVESHQGLGTRVRSIGADKGYIHHVTTIGDLFPVNVTTNYDPVDGTLVPLPEPLRSVQPVPKTKGPSWLYISGHRHEIDDATPINEFDIYVAGRFAGVGRVVNSRAGSAYSALEMIYGETVGRVHQVIRGFKADAVRGRLLGLAPGEPGIEVQRVFQLASDGDVAIVSLNRYRADNFSFSFTLDKLKG